MANAPETVAPEQHYLGVFCISCGKTFPLAGPLDPQKVPIDKPIRLAAKGPLTADCPHCHHHGEYTIHQVTRVPAPE